MKGRPSWQLVKGKMRPKVTVNTLSLFLPKECQHVLNSQQIHYIIPRAKQGTDLSFQEEVCIDSTTVWRRIESFIPWPLINKNTQRGNDSLHTP